MARNRLIKQEFYVDPKVGSLPLGARLLFIALWIHADDSGNGHAEPATLKAQAFIFDNDIITDTVEAWMRQLADKGMVVVYSVKGAQYYHVKNFLKHQTINRPSKFRHPGREQADNADSRTTHEPISEHSQSTHGVLTEDSVSPQGAVYEHSRIKEEREGKREAPSSLSNTKTPAAGAADSQRDAMLIEIQKLAGRTVSGYKVIAAADAMLQAYETAEIVAAFKEHIYPMDDFAMKRNVETFFVPQGEGGGWLVIEERRQRAAAKKATEVLMARQEAAIRAERQAEREHEEAQAEQGKADWEAVFGPEDQATEAQAEQDKADWEAVFGPEDQATEAQGGGN